MSDKIIKPVEPGWGGVEVAVTLNGRQYMHYWAGDCDLEEIKNQLKRLSDKVLKEVNV